MIAVALSGYGLYRALYVPAMLVGPPVPLLRASPLPRQASCSGPHPLLEAVAIRRRSAVAWPAREQHLRQMLEHLHTELQRADTIDDRSRELLRSVLGDIEDLLERKQKQGTQPESIIERLRETVRAFETTHPTLTNAIGRVADALAGMGI